MSDIGGMNPLATDFLNFLNKLPETAKSDKLPPEKKNSPGKAISKSNSKDNYSVQNKQGNAGVHTFVENKAYSPQSFISDMLPVAAMLVTPAIGVISKTASIIGLNNKKEPKGLKVEITDINGFGDSAGKAENDLKIKASGNLKISRESILNMINSGTGKVLSESWTGDATLGKASFDKNDRSYYIPIKSFLDDFGLEVKTEGNKLVIRTANDQLASLKDVLGVISDKVKSAKLPFKVVKYELYSIENGKMVNDPRIELIPDLKALPVSKSVNITGSNINEKNTRLNFDEKGNLNIVLDNVEMEGKEVIRDLPGLPKVTPGMSKDKYLEDFKKYLDGIYQPDNYVVPEKSGGDADHASITIGEEIRIKPGKANSTLGDVEIDITGGNADLELDEKESDFNINELNLGKQFSNTKIKADNLHGKITLKTDKSYENIPAKIPYSEVFKAQAKMLDPFNFNKAEAMKEYFEKIDKATPKNYENKITTTIIDGFGGNISLDTRGPDRNLKVKGTLELNLKNEKTVFGNKEHENLTKSKFEAKLRNNSIETSIKYKDGTFEGNTTKMDVDAGIDERGNITFKQNILETDAGIENTFNKPSTGTFEPISGSTGAFNKLIKDAAKAKESINIETFLFNGEPAEKLSKILVKKASEGVKVKLIIDSAFGDKKDTKGETITKDNESEFNKGAVILSRAKADLIKSITGDKTLSPLKKKELAENIEKNLDWRILEHGMLRIDHRKIWIIDGKEAITGGGVNLTQSAIVGSKKDDGTLKAPKHDSMYEIHGPVIRQLAEGFIGFWNKNSESPMEKSDVKKLLKSEKELEAEMLQYKKDNKNLSVSKTQVLYTDEKHKQIYQKMIEKVKKAEHVINLEHAYLDHPELQKALEDAVVRGVTVNVLLPEKSDEQDFILYNNYNAVESLKLKALEPGSKGKVNAYFYKDDVAFNHSKLISFDGKSAILGSANTTSRSLDNPVHYNKEMALYVEDDHFVKNIDKNMFEKDINDSSINLQNIFNWVDNIILNQNKINRYKDIDGAS